MKRIEASAFRARLIETFLDFQSKERLSYYRNRILTTRVEDGKTVYDGYLWECLKYPIVHSEARCRSFLKNREKGFLCLADLHSGPGSFPEPYDGAIAFESYDEFAATESSLPEDLYLFDESLLWLVVLTHEDIDGRRHCILIEDVRSL